MIKNYANDPALYETCLSLIDSCFPGIKQIADEGKRHDAHWDETAFSFSLNFKGEEGEFKNCHGTEAVVNHKELLQLHFKEDDKGQYNGSFFVGGFKMVNLLTGSKLNNGILLIPNKFQVQQQKALNKDLEKNNCLLVMTKRMKHNNKVPEPSI